MTYLTEGALKNSDAGKTYRQRYQALRKIIGGNIKQVREGLSIDYETLSIRTGVKIRKLKYWEMGRMEINLAAIVRIAAALDVPQSALLDTNGIHEDGNTEGESTDADVDAADADTENEAGEPENMKVGKDGWHEDFEVQIYQAVKRRLDNSEGFPDRDTLFAMEEPIYRMMKASVLFCDLAHGARDYDPPKPSGLVYLSTSMRREAERLYCLFTGIRPEY